MIFSDCLLRLDVDGAPVLVVGMAFALVGGLYPYDPMVLIGALLMPSFFTFEFNGRVWALTESSLDGSLILFGAELMLDVGLECYWYLSCGLMSCCCCLFCDLILILCYH